MEPQAELDLIYRALASGEISRREYFTQINAVADARPEVAARFSYRRDRRTLGHFALMLYDDTCRERFLLERCWPGVRRDGDTHEDLGVDNGGRLVLDVRSGGRNLDFLVRNEALGDYPLEVKFGVTQKFLTYKVADLENVLRTPDARILTVSSPERMAGPNGDPDRDVRFTLARGSFFLLMDHDAVGRLVGLGEHARHGGFGGKPTVRIFASQFHLVAPATLIEETSLAH